MNRTDRFESEEPAGDARLIGHYNDDPPGAIERRDRAGRAGHEPYAARVADVVRVLDHDAVAIEEDRPLEWFHGTEDDRKSPPYR